MASVSARGRGNWECCRDACLILKMKGKRERQMEEAEEKKYRSLPGIVMTSFGSEYYLVKARKLSADRDKYLISMNEIAAFYWNMLETPVTESEMLAKLSEEYDVADSDAAAADLRALLEKWESAGCVEACD